jgi:26S proteasome regulatory subunit N8
VYHLQDALNLLPDISDQITTQSFASSTNDQLLVVYLSSLLRAVIALHGLVDNKSTIGRAEQEEEKPKEKANNKEKDAKEKDAKDKTKDSDKSKAEDKGL